MAWISAAPSWPTAVGDRAVAPTRRTGPEGVAGARQSSRTVSRSQPRLAVEAEGTRTRHARARARVDLEEVRPADRVEAVSHRERSSRAVVQARRSAVAALAPRRPARWRRPPLGRRWRVGAVARWMPPTAEEEAVVAERGGSGVGAAEPLRAVAPARAPAPVAAAAARRAADSETHETCPAPVPLLATRARRSETAPGRVVRSRAMGRPAAW